MTLPSPSTATIATAPGCSTISRSWSPQRSTVDVEQLPVVDPFVTRPASCAPIVPRARAARRRTTAASRRRRSRARAPDRASRGSTTSTRSSESAHFSSACAHVSTPSSRAARARRPAARRSERALAERPHHDHGDAELGGEREQLALALALARVVRQLHASKRRVRSASRELAERRSRRSASRRAGRSGPRRAPPRARQVLLARRRGCGSARPRRGRTTRAARVLLAALADATRAQIFVATTASSRRPRERGAERALGAAVHRRRVERRAAGVERRVDDLARQRRVAVERRSRCRARRPGRAAAPPSAEHCSRELPGGERRREEQRILVRPASHVRRAAARRTPRASRRRRPRPRHRPGASKPAATAGGARSTARARGRRACGARRRGGARAVGLRDARTASDRRPAERRGRVDAPRRPRGRRGRSAMPVPTTPGPTAQTTASKPSPPPTASAEQTSTHSHVAVEARRRRRPPSRRGRARATSRTAVGERDRQRAARAAARTRRGRRASPAQTGATWLCSEQQTTGMPAERLRRARRPPRACRTAACTGVYGSFITCAPSLGGRSSPRVRFAYSTSKPPEPSPSSRACTLTSTSSPSATGPVSRGYATHGTPSTSSRTSPSCRSTIAVTRPRLSVSIARRRRRSASVTSTIASRSATAMRSSGVWMSAIPLARLTHCEAALVEDVRVGAAAAERRSSAS